MELYNSVFVYYARLADGEIKSIYPREREEEIRTAKNQLQRAEKYSVWKLFEFAIKDALGKDIEELIFSKSPSGKWVTDGFDFSLTHSEGIVAVAFAKEPVGVDVQVIKAPRSASFAKRVLTDAELKEYGEKEETERTKYLIAKWSAKESLFKTESKDLFVPRDYIPTKENSLTDIISLDGVDYALSVAHLGREVKIKFVEDIK